MPVSLSGYLKSTAHWAPLVLRLVLGTVFITHGSQKVFGFFGGGGIEETTAGMRSLGLVPAIFWAWVLGLTELLSGIAVLVGLFTGIACLAIIIIMVVAIAIVLLPKGFVGGYEYNLALIAMALSLILSGPGALSIDRIIRWKY